MNYGYIRVSAKDQNEARQLAALSGLNIPAGNIYLDKQSGKNLTGPLTSACSGGCVPAMRSTS